MSLSSLKTILCQSESILKSRPIGVRLEDPNVDEFLTTARFLCGTELEIFLKLEIPKKKDRRLHFKSWMAGHSKRALLILETQAKVIRNLPTRRKKIVQKNYHFEG